MRLGISGSRYIFSWLDKYAALLFYSFNPSTERLIFGELQGKKLDIQTYRYTYKQTDIQTERHTDRKTYIQTDILTDRQSGREIHPRELLFGKIQGVIL